MEKIKFNKGESVSIGFLLNEEYDITRIQSCSGWIGGKKFPLAKIGQMLRLEVASNESHKLGGRYKLILWIDDIHLGVKEIPVADVEILVNNANDNNESINTGYDFIFPLAINEVAITLGDVMYNYVKGANGDSFTYEDFTPEQLEALKGDDGDDGVGISSIELISKVGLIATYRITLTNASFYEYTVADGEDGINGLSAFESAVLGGYTGTEEQFYTDLATVSSKVDKVTGSSLVPDTSIAENITAVKKVTTLTVDGGQLTGFVNPIAVDVSYDGATRKITLTGNVAARWQGISMTELVPSFVSGWQSEAHDIADGEYFLSFNGTSFVWSTVAFDFKQLQIAFVYRDGVNVCIRECHGLQDWQSHEANHNNVGTVLRSGADVAGFTLNSDVVANRRPTVSQALVYDEDLPSNLLALTNGLYTRLFLDGANNANFETDKTDIIEYTAGNRFLYNLFTGGVWTKATAANNQYAKIFLMAIPTTSDLDCQKSRFVWIMPQTVNATLLTIQALAPSSVNLGQISTALAEYVFVQEFIIRATASGWTIISTAKLTGNKRFQSVTSGNFLSSVAHDSSITGDGTVGGPLSVSHNDTTGIQGGAVGDRQHLTTAQVAKVDASALNTDLKKLSDNVIHNDRFKNIIADNSSFENIKNSIIGVFAVGYNINKRLYIQRFSYPGAGGIIAIDLYDDDGTYLGLYYKTNFTKPTGITSIVLTRANNYITQLIFHVNWDLLTTPISINSVKSIEVFPDYVDRSYILSEIKYTNSPILNKLALIDNANVLNSIIKDIQVIGYGDKNIYIERFRFVGDGGILQIDVYDEDGIYLASTYITSYTRPIGETIINLTTRGFYVTKFAITVDWGNVTSINSYVPKGILVKKTLEVQFFLEREIRGYCKSLTNKDYLAIGDSITFYDNYQKQIAKDMNLNVTTHALGGIGLVQMVDGTTGIGALTSSQVTGKKLITIFGGLNDRSALEGVPTDLYPTQDTICGRLNYALNKIFTLLNTAGNTTARVICILPHKVGKYAYIDSDGDDEYPNGSGQSLYTVTRKMKQVCELKAIPCIDLYQLSGINEYTWSTYTANTLPSGGVPYPLNRDNVHLSTIGYDRISDIIIAQLKSFN